MYTHKSYSSNYRFWYLFPLPTPGQSAEIPPQTPHVFCETYKFFFNVQPPHFTEAMPCRLVAYLFNATRQLAGKLLCQNSLDSSDLMAKREIGERVEVITISRGYLSIIPGDYDYVERWLEIRYHDKKSEQVGLTNSKITVEYVKLKEWYNVLGVEWIDNITYHRCLGRILKDVWEAQDLESVSLVLVEDS